MTRDAPDHALASGEPRLRVGQGALWGGCAMPPRRSRSDIARPAFLVLLIFGSFRPAEGNRRPRVVIMPLHNKPQKAVFRAMGKPRKVRFTPDFIGRKNIFAWSEVGDDRRSLARCAVERRKPIRLRRSPTSVATASSPSSGLRPWLASRTRARADSKEFRKKLGFVSFPLAFSL